MKIVLLLFWITTVFLSNSLLSQLNAKNLGWDNKDLQTTTFNSGKPIARAYNAQEWSSYCESYKPCYMIMNNGVHLYNYFVLMDSDGIEPLGYRIAESTDFEQLMNTVSDKKNLKGTKMLAAQHLINYSYFVEDMDEVNGGLVEKKVTGYNTLDFNATKTGYIENDGSLGGFFSDAESTNSYSSLISSNSGEPTCSYWWVKNNRFSYGVINFGYCSQDMMGIENAGGYTYVSGDDYQLSKMGFAIRLVSTSNDIKRNFHGLFLNNTWVITHGNSANFHPDGKWFHLTYNENTGRYFYAFGDDLNIIEMNECSVEFGTTEIKINLKEGLILKVQYPETIPLNEYNELEWNSATIEEIRNGNFASGTIEKGPNGRIPVEPNWPGRKP
jgi:uncharacterized protein (TIGR02145 family)